MTLPHSISSAKSYVRLVSLADSKDFAACAQAMSSAFAKVPCTIAFAAESNQTIQVYVDKTIRHSILHNQGVLIEAGNMSAVALWELPNLRTEIAEEPTSPCDHDHLATKLTLFRPVKEEWNKTIYLAKQKYIGIEFDQSGDVRIRPHYHLDFLGRNPSVAKTPGAVSGVISIFLRQAEQDGLDVWLEAVSEELVPMYEHFGFEVVEVIGVGAGRVDVQGKPKKDGEGFKAWLMIIRNHIDP